MNGRQVIEQLNAGNFDLVLMDLQMPVMDGYETARYIRKEMKNDIPIIAITADMFISETPEFIEAGMNDYITKPINASILNDLILKLVKPRVITK